MNEQQRDRVHDLASLVHVVHIQRAKPVYADIARELRELIDIFLVHAPVVPVAPACEKSLHVRERCAVLPTSLVELVREAREREAVAQLGKVGVGDRNFESLW